MSPQTSVDLKCDWKVNPIFAAGGRAATLSPGENCLSSECLCQKQCCHARTGATLCHDNLPSISSSPLQHVSAFIQTVWPSSLHPSCQEQLRGRKACGEAPQALQTQRLETPSVWSCYHVHLIQTHMQQFKNTKTLGVENSYPRFNLKAAGLGVGEVVLYHGEGGPSVVPGPLWPQLNPR